jgi:hypothetical protein
MPGPATEGGSDCAENFTFGAQLCCDRSSFLRQDDLGDHSKGRTPRTGPTDLVGALAVGVLAGCTATSTAPTVSSTPLALYSPGYAPEFAGAVRVGSWHGIGPQQVRYQDTSGVHQLGVRIVCASGDFAVRSATGQRLFWGRCTPDQTASGATSPQRWGSFLTVEVGNGVAWQADIWALA